MFTRHKTATSFSSLFAGFAAVSAFALARVAHAKDTTAQAASRKAIMANYAIYSRALKNRDAAAFVSVMAPDYMHHTREGQVIDRATEANQWNRMFTLPIRITRFDVRVQKWMWRGPDAVAWVRVTMTVVPTFGARRATTNYIETRDYWGPTSSGWKLRQTVDLSSTSPFG